MTEGLEKLSDREYPGRVIILGRDRSGENNVVVYAITGRSPSSQARKIEFEKDTAWVRPVDDEILNKGNIDLLIYPAILISGGIAVSNGKQTLDIKNCIHQSQNPVKILELAHSRWNYEPDDPAFTPRISGCIIPENRAALGIIKRAEDSSSTKNYFEVPLNAGKARMITTYTGENIDPLPSFDGGSVDLDLFGKTADDVAGDVYYAMGSKIHDEDFRVSVICIFYKELEANKYDISIINRCERTKK
ncbi:MAG: IMP cyclohydrolase [Acidobacteriota bacterium]|nr:IMP cyclohydrolase [Acidobacteriota bacterium]